MKLSPELIKYIVIHHVGNGCKGGDVRFIRKIHVVDNGWNDVGYHKVICNGLKHGEWVAGEDGEIQDGRPLTECGAHCRNWQVSHNRDSIGICLIGDFMIGKPTAKQISSLTEACLSLCKRFNLDPVTAIVGHRDLIPTDCPGNNLYVYLPALRYIIKGYCEIDRLIT